MTSEAAGKSVIVIGGGVAGIAASVSLAKVGFRVQLIEKRLLLGGRASSHIDPATGERIDECQHGTMRCCTALTHLFELLGVSDQIRYFDRLEFLDGDGVRSSIYGSSLPAPLHTSLSFLRFRSLGLKDKIGIARAMIAMLRAPDSPDLDVTDIEAWLVRNNQTDRAIRRFWGPILVSACNETLVRISCRHAFKIFVDGFLMNARAYQFGVPRVPLGTLYSEPTERLLETLGGCVRKRTIVEKLHFDEAYSAVTGITLIGGETLQSDEYILTLQQDLLVKLLPDELFERSDYWRSIRSIEMAPIIGVHLWYDRPIECPEALALLDRETEWVFNKSLNFNLEPGQGAYLSAVISASHRYTAASKDEILAVVLKDLNAALPQTQTAVLVRHQVIKWPKATFSPLTGVETHRPNQQSPIKNLTIAGEWTDTGWPSTMESAARSGFLAAAVVAGRAGIHGCDLPRIYRPATWLGSSDVLAKDRSW